MKDYIKNMYRIYMNTKKSTEKKQDYKLIIGTAIGEIKHEKRATNRRNNK